LSAGLAFSPQVVQQVKGAPQAYLSFIAYDSTGSYISSDYQLLTREARDNCQQLKREYTAGQDGYVEVFTANESGQDAYFDDLLLTTHAAMQVQENHYDPWGLNLVGIESQGSPDHKFQYNCKEKQEEFGLHWNDYGARFYDSQLGRWHVLDPMADQMRRHSLYNYGFDNPNQFIVPNGMAPEGFGDDIFEFMAGVGDAAASNMANNGLSRDENRSGIFATGQKAGDFASVLVGAAETAIGTIVVGGSAAVTIVSGGLTWKVSVPAALVGAGVAAHGRRTMMNADKNFKATNQNGRVNAGKGKNHLQRNKDATGPHSSFEREGPVGPNGNKTGPVKKHAEYTPNTQNPTGFDEVQRTDLNPNSAPHTNKKTGQTVLAPHTQGRNIPGGVRPATPQEMPRTLRQALGF
jgi:RHS repeat-associated protein